MKINLWAIGAMCVAIAGAACGSVMGKDTDRKPEQTSKTVQSVSLSDYTWTGVGEGEEGCRNGAHSGNIDRRASCTNGATGTFRAMSICRSKCTSEVCNGADTILLYTDRNVTDDSFYTCRNGAWDLDGYCLRHQGEETCKDSPVEECTLDGSGTGSGSGSGNTISIQPRYIEARPDEQHGSMCGN
jgi:hypothetical protein